MKTRDRYSINIDAGTTFRFAFRAGETEGEERVYYTAEDITSVQFQVRASDNGHKATYPMEYVDDKWNVVISPGVTAAYSAHRAVYYVIDATFASGDVVRLLEGPIRVRPLGGAYRG